MINCLIVDDEPLAADVIESFVAKMPHLNLVAKLNSATEALSVLKSEKLITDKKFSTNSQRVKNRTALFEILKKEIKKHKATELMKQFIQKDIPAGRIKSVKEALEEKPAKQLLLKENTVLNGRSIRVKSNIFKITN